MKPRLALLALFVAVAVAARAADAAPLFNALLSIGKDSRFVLVDAAGKTSGFLALGQSFAGYNVWQEHLVSPFRSQTFCLVSGISSGRDESLGRQGSTYADNFLVRSAPQKRVRDRRNNVVCLPNSCPLESIRRRNIAEQDLNRITVPDFLEHFYTVVYNDHSFE